MISRQNIDIELIKRARKGDERAFSELFDFYFNKVYYYIFMFVKDNIESEDLTMITIEKAFKNLNKYTPFFEFKTWLFKIAKNTTLDCIRYSGRRIITTEITNTCFLKEYIENPERILISKQTTEIIESSLKEIPFVFQRVLEMRDEGLQCKEIASKLDVSINTVVGQIRYARKYVSQILDKKLAS
jgi:RNA polymerase sigma factor (sigma-70 family)